MFQVGFLPTLPSLLASPRVPLIHRDVSWLQFNDRVLAEARQASNPLLERIKFLAISASNQDEFFMIRFSALGRSIAAANRRNASNARRLIRIRTSILETVSKFGGRQLEAMDLLTAELDGAGVHIVRGAREGETAFGIGKRIFVEQVLPNLGPPHAFTRLHLTSLQNLQTLALFSGELCFRIPRQIPSVICHRDESSGEIYAFFLDDLLASHLGPAFRLEGNPGFLRLTRDGDFTVDLDEEDPESIPDVVRSGVGRRELGRPVRLQYSGEVSESLLGRCVKTLNLIPAQVLPAPGTLFMHGLWTVFHATPDEFRAKPGLCYPPQAPVLPKPFENPTGLWEKLKREDILLHHPYDSFDAYVTWIKTACEDPDVVSIEQTVYRMDQVSPVIQALKDAVKAKKKVRVAIELRARFDELNNLRLADELQKAGVQVAFGFGKLKLHAKVALITRREEGGLKYYTHLSTGNYNRSTARQYTDLAILTANSEIGEDARYFFESVFNEEVPSAFKRLVSAPGKLHRRLIQHIQAETEAAKKGLKARIVAKVNALVDSDVIEHLYRASNAGVQVDLIVRGACSLVPGVKGLSANIRVISVVDRYLEHSRIYWFASQKAMYLSSADWMPRNFFSRLEIAFPVLDPNLYRYLEEVLVPAYFADTVKSRELTPMGTWKKRAVRGSSIRSQQFFQDLATKQYQGTPLE